MKLVDVLVGNYVFCKSKKAYSKGDFILALNYAEKACNLTPNKITYLKYYSFLCSKVGDEKKEFEVLNKIISLKKDDYESLFNLGCEYEGSGKITDAKRLYERAIQINSLFVPAWNNLGLIVLDSEENPEVALKYIEKAISISPDDPRVNCSYGKCLISLNRDTEAEKILINLIKEDSENYHALYWLGVINEKKGNYQLSIEYYKKMYKLNPNDKCPCFALGNCYFILHEFEKAEEYFSIGYRIDSDYGYGIIQYSELLKADNRFTQGIRILNSYLKNHPDDGEIWYCLGNMCKAADKTLEAEDAFGKARINGFARVDNQLISESLPTQ